MTSTSNHLNHPLRATTETLQETGQRTFAAVLLSLVLEPLVLHQEGHTSQVLQISCYDPNQLLWPVLISKPKLVVMTSTSNPLNHPLRATTETLQETGQRTFAVVLLCLVLEPLVLKQEGHISQVLQIRYTYLVPFLSGLGNKFFILLIIHKACQCVIGHQCITNVSNHLKRN